MWTLQSGGCSLGCYSLGEPKSTSNRFWVPKKTHLTVWSLGDYSLGELQSRGLHLPSSRYWALQPTRLAVGGLQYGRLQSRGLQSSRLSLGPSDHSPDSLGVTVREGGQVIIFQQRILEPSDHSPDSLGATVRGHHLPAMDFGSLTPIS